jgi:hypothetical protein
MSSNNSYTYYNRFLKCLRRYLEKIVEKRKKDKWIDDPETLYVDLTIDDIYAAFKFVFDNFIKKAPSACMGADDWFDRFLVKADMVLCSGVWCFNERCSDNDTGSPYYCLAGNIPGKCEKWKAWRLTWRSYPENELCQKCRYFKPDKADQHWKITEQQLKKINEYKCYCRKKELPGNCPKKGKIK